MTPTFDYTKRNHFRCEPRDGQLHIAFGRCERAPLDFRQESVKAVEDIRASTSEADIFVLLSGGIDGEIVCRSFLEAGLKFTPVFYRWVHGLNADEAYFAEKFCRQFDLKLKSVDVDPIAFFTQGFRTHCAELRLPLWSAVWKHWLYSLHEGFIIAADGWPKFEVGGVVVDSHAMNPLAPYGRPGVPDFFRYSPELVAGILNDSLVKRWAVDCRQSFESHPAFKYFAMTRFWRDERHPIEFREKRTGIEKILPLAQTAAAEAREKYSANVLKRRFEWHELADLLNL